MKELIYYPGFQVRNTDWLKFALLYIDQLRPIIPESGDHYVDDFYRKITNEADLLNTYRPQYKEGLSATIAAIDIIEKILKHPTDFVPFFRTNNFLEKWKNPINQDYLLFNEKYTPAWEDFCKKNKFSQDTSRGIFISEELCFIYMTLLAQAISDQKGISPITDYRRLDILSIFSRKEKRGLLKNNWKIAEGIFNIKLPSNINQISIDSILKLRARSDFKIKQKAFHDELDNYLSNIENGATSSDFIKSFDTAWNDYLDQFMYLGANLVIYGLSVWILVNAPVITTAAYVKDVVAVGALSYIGSTITIRKNWKGIQTKRYARKYLADLEMINAPDRNSKDWVW
jgi:hypothetical protein